MSLSIYTEKALFVDRDGVEWDDCCVVNGDNTVNPSPTLAVTPWVNDKVLSCGLVGFVNDDDCDEIVPLYG